MNRKTYDAILLLGLRLHGDGTATPELKLRVEKAAACYRQGLAPVIIACGGLTEGIPRREADVMADMLTASGVPESAVIREGESTVTRENILNAIPLMGGARGRRALVVSSDYHIFRARLICRSLGLRADGRGARLPLSRYTPNLYILECFYLAAMALKWDIKGYPGWAKKVVQRLHVPR